MFQKEISRCEKNPDRFNTTVLHRDPYWAKQREICESIVKYPITCVPTGNGVGKSYVDAGIIAWFATLHVNSNTVVAAPTQAQLSGVLWGELEAAAKSAEDHGRPLGGRFRGLTLEFGENWRVEGYGSGSVESKSGRHAKDLLAVVDEASGVDATVHEAVDSLNPSRRLYTGNPIKPEGKFYELCQLSGDNPNVNVIQISSLESPHVGLERSPWGMADAPFISNARYEYGEDSLWWLVHILGRFPGELDEALLPIKWLNLASQTVHRPAGPCRLGVDIAKGIGEGDLSLVVARDDNGALGAWYSRSWSLEHLAKVVRLRVEEYGVDPTHIVYDATGIGTDFDNRLRAQGLVGAKGYMGANAGGPRFANLRSACGWYLRRRLDPSRSNKLDGPSTRNDRLQWHVAASVDTTARYSEQPPFALPKHLLDTFRRELQGCRYALNDHGQIALEPKVDFVKRLKFSPNFLDALAMTFAFPHT
jgi:phage terminase large subunit